MIYFLKGKIMKILKESIIINVDNIGYEVFLSHPNDFTIDEECFIYTHLVLKEEIQYIVGFISLEEKELFNNLLKVNGLGPKTILNIFRSFTIDEIVDGIATGNIKMFTKINGVSVKLANQIIFELESKMSLKRRNPELYTNLELALREMGYKKKEIDLAVKKIKTNNLSLEELIKSSLIELRSIRDEK